MMYLSAHAPHFTDGYLTVHINIYSHVQTWNTCSLLVCTHTCTCTYTGTCKEQNVHVPWVIVNGIGRLFDLKLGRFSPTGIGQSEEEGGGRACKFASLEPTAP